MRTPIGLTSSLADRMVQFIAFKRMQGYEYRDGSDRLRRFDVFLAKTGYDSKVLHLEALDRYRSQIDGLSHSTRAGSLSTLRQFSLYLHALAPESAVLPPRLVPRERQSIRFYPLSSTQVGELMAATVTLKPDNGIRADCIRLLIGLLYTTGLRIAEALALNLADVDTVDSTLFVRRGKFRKERIVSMSSSTCEAVGLWLVRRANYAGSEPSAPLFVAEWNRRLNPDPARRIFRRLCIHCGLDGPSPPRLHDLRHNYACGCVALWREAQEDVDALLPVLANAMGHVNFHATEIYIHMNAAALQQACGKFQQHVHNYLEHRT